MALLFSAVTVTAGYDQAEFTVGGIPREYDDLVGWTAFDDFMENVDAETEVSVHAEVYLYGGEETVTATPEEVAYLMIRMERDENFLAGHCDNIEDVDFSFLRPPDETYVSDCISKRVKVNNGERNKYYIENNHPAIIDAGTFARVQEEIARRSGKPKVKQKGTKTELSRYSSKYALSELLICGECRTPYRRCTWTAKGKRKIVWRCINRLDYGKKNCHHSPSIEESLLQDAVMRAIMQTAKQNVEVLKTLKIHIGMGLTDEITEDKTLDIQIRIAKIDAEFQKMLKSVSADNADGIDEERITELMNEKQRLTVQLEQYAAMRQKRESAKSRLDEIFTILDGLQNHPMEYDDTLVRQIIECVVVESKEKIKVVFIGGTEIEMTL